MAAWSGPQGTGKDCGSRRQSCRGNRRVPPGQPDLSRTARFELRGRSGGAHQDALPVARAEIQMVNEHGTLMRRTTAIAMLVVACFAVAFPRGAKHASGWSRAALKNSFESDMRHVVYRWDPADARTEEERQAALFDFVYQTYDSSAWIPQSLFDGNLATQTIVGDIDTIVRDKVGLVLWRDNPRVPAFGMAPNVNRGEPLKWTVNCITCHTAEID